MSDTSWVPIELLIPSDWPRVSGEVVQHTRMLAGLDDPLPPILVRRESMQVVDGMHRLRAAALRKQERIEVRFFDGNETAAFIAAVEANVKHGLPLTLADREAAAVRIISVCPTYSNRAVAAIVGLSDKTVAAIRRRRHGSPGEASARVGRDGRVRRLDSSEARRVASEEILRRPDASLRQIARVAGLSPSTVRDVRDRIRRGAEPTTAERMHSISGGHGAPPAVRTGHRFRTARVAAGDVRDRTSLLRVLNQDPSLRFTDTGRDVLRWLLNRVGGPHGWPDVATKIPPHCAYVVAEMARDCAADWAAFADHLEASLRDSA